MNRLLTSQWKMASSNAPRVLQGVFAINKPTIEKPRHPQDHMSSQKVLDQISAQFNDSSTFQPLLEEQKRSVLEAKRQNGRRPRGPNRMTRVKIGHGGTLDPLATGILVVGVGNGTKSMAKFLAGCTKTYEATLLFGAASDTFDVCGKILKRGPYGHITKELIEKTLDVYRGKTRQKPPIFSALKVQGKPMYEYAREGREIPDLPERDVDVSELELLEFMPGGTHGYKYILENASDEPEAPEEMKANADKLIEATLSQVTKDYLASKRQQKAQEPGEKPTGEEAAPSADLKRKRDGEEDQDSEPPTKKTHADESATTEAPESTSPSATISPPTDGTQAPAARIRITSSSGFYVRSLVHELAVAMDSLAVMAALKRTKQAKFELGKNVLEWDDLQAGEHAWGPKVRQSLEEWMDAGESDADRMSGPWRGQGPDQGQRSPRQWQGQMKGEKERERARRSPARNQSHERRQSWDRGQSHERRSRTPEKKGEARTPATEQQPGRVQLDEDDDWGEF
ncbi:pseudouridine synthase [Phyllosticta citricarpa]|uniref:tRNA pseudouridine(55) synthase n=2 Tax=Phyllosticta TaxID=121621 RepID=A0ABR1MZV0_9PEZI